MDRTSVNYRDFEGDMKLLVADDLVSIELKAKALSIDDCFAFLCLDPEEVPEEDMKLAKKAWRRGRASALSTAADKMFASMSARGGGQVAMDYLRQLSDTFSIEVNPVTNTPAGTGFNFSVKLDEDKEKDAA